MIMDYKLAKELKDAGFPQTSDEGRESENVDVFIEPSGTLCRRWNAVEFPAYRIPTLEELIEACRKEKHFVSVGESGHVPEEWEAKIECWERYQEPGDDVREFKVGSTPQIAVAKLWLALRGKQQS